MKLQISLDENDIKCLIGGGLLTIAVPHEPQEIALCMKDFGFRLIYKMMSDIEYEKIEPYQDLNRINQVGWQP